jgi:argininosuccinate lyase
MRLWGGRTIKPTDPRVERYNASLSFDLRLAGEDVRGSQAWARALARAGVLPAGEAEAIQRCLADILADVDQGTFHAAPSDEDIHTAVERLLTERLGPVAGKLHTGRSRNDQVATDFRLWIMAHAPRLAGCVLDLQEAFFRSALADLRTPMPGYTHLRQAQPVTWGHWALWHFWALGRDVGRLDQVRRSAAILPLGSGALAGTAFPIDRMALARELGFDGVSPNSLDAVSDRDFAVEFLFAGALLGVHLSRLAEQLILYSTAEFGFVELDEAFTTGSSLMPHKRNPDPLELARGKAGRLIGHLTGLLTTLKGLPSAYDKDLQEDKEPVFDAYDTLAETLPVLTGLIGSLRLRPERMRSALSPETFAVDLADHLAARGVPFRQAHEFVGQAILKAESLGVGLDQMRPEDWQAVSPLFGEEMAGLFDVGRALDRRAADGGTAAAALQAQAEAAQGWLASRGRPAVEPNGAERG